jgi:hypothetical protein
MAAVQPAIETALASDWLRPETVIVFPERTGLYLALAEEWPGVYGARNLAEAAARALAPSPERWMGWVRRGLRSGWSGAAVQELFWAKAARAAQLADELFGGLGARYRLAVVGGSGLSVRDGSVRVEGRVYGPDGGPIAAFGKERLDDFEAEVLGCPPGQSGRFAHAGQEYVVALGSDPPPSGGVALNPTAGAPCGSEAVACRLQGRLWGEAYGAGQAQPAVRNVWL